MAWIEVSPGLFRRPIGENETFIRMLGDSGHPLEREHWSVSCISTLAPRGDLTSDGLSQLMELSWKLLRFDHPSIAAVTDGDNLVYEVPKHQGSLDKWAAEACSSTSNETFMCSTADKHLASRRFKSLKSQTLTPSYPR